MSLLSSMFRGSEFFVLRGIQAATDQCTAKLCWERDSCIRQKRRLGDLKFPFILGFQILCLIETEVNMKSSIGLPSRAPALGFCFPTFECKHVCQGTTVGRGSLMVKEARVGRERKERSKRQPESHLTVGE